MYYQYTFINCNDSPMQGTIDNISTMVRTIHSMWFFGGPSAISVPWKWNESKMDLQDQIVLSMLQFETGSLSDIGRGVLEATVIQILLFYNLFNSTFISSRFMPLINFALDNISYVVWFCSAIEISGFISISPWALDVHVQFTFNIDANGSWNDVVNFIHDYKY